ncbi:hypothetical protein P691DRAFT_709749, partial [Macrolepiota fuliginosa MF-IS2]
MLYAALGPEFIMVWALRQRIGAARHVEEYNKSAHWTLTHGFLLEMRGIAKYEDGRFVGFVREVDELSEPFDLPEDEIIDKSKGDFLTKLLVILQTTWFMFQCLARWTTHLPVTELEIVTLAFTFLNILTYSFWWYKPQNVRV